MKAVVFPDNIAEQLLALRKAGYSGQVVLHLKDGVPVKEAHIQETAA